jgi:predicted phage terminase large subunit-like protein
MSKITPLENARILQDDIEIFLTQNENLEYKDIYDICSVLSTIQTIYKRYMVDQKVKEIFHKNKEITNRIYKRFNLLDSMQDLSIIKVAFVKYRSFILSSLSPLINDELELETMQIEQENQYLIDRSHLSIDEIRELLLNSHDEFCNFMFNEIEGKYLTTPFDTIFNATIDKVFKGEITRLIINMPVGNGKTAKGLIAVIARGFAIESRSRFLAISYDTTLVQLNSSIIRDFINTANFQMLFGVDIKNDSSAKGLWRTSTGGALRAVSSGSGITGFRADNIALEGFGGLMIIDDPLKPDDARTGSKLEWINNRYETTFKSRLARESCPIIVIMQRLHHLDFTNHLLSKYGKEWYHLALPALIEDYNVIDDRGVTIHHGLPLGALWEQKYSKEVLLREKELNPNYFFSQLQQNPINIGKSNLIKSEWLNEYSMNDLSKLQIKRVYMFADTANKANTWNDYTVFIVVAQCVDNNLYILDLFRDKVEFNLLLYRFKEFYSRHLYNSNLYPDNICIPSLSLAYIEDKASGTSLIQVVREEGINVLAIQRNKDKLYRLSNVSHLFYQGRVYLPKSASWTQDVKRECDEFTIDDTHEHDDMLDCIIDSLDVMVLGTMSKINVTKQVAKSLPV